MTSSPAAPTLHAAWLQSWCVPSTSPCWQGVIIKSVVLERRPIPASYFAERVVGIDLPAAKRIHEQLRAVGALDDQDYIEWTRWCVTPPPLGTQCFLPLHAEVLQALAGTGPLLCDRGAVP